MTRRARRDWMVVAAAVISCGACAGDPPSATVGIMVVGCPPEVANGTGVVIEPRLVLTAAHTLKGAEEISVTNGDRETTGVIVAFDPEMDLAYVELADDIALPVPLGRRAAPEIERGTPGRAYVFRDGEALALDVTIRRAVTIHTEDIYVEGDTYRPGFELDADIEAGDSGGPVVVDGRVVGVLSLRSRRFESRAYAIDAIRAGATIRDQVATGEIGDDIDLSRCT